MGRSADEAHVASALPVVMHAIRALTAVSVQSDSSVVDHAAHTRQRIRDLDSIVQLHALGVQLAPSQTLRRRHALLAYSTFIMVRSAMRETGE